jgi:hypothetical protein
MFGEFVLRCERASSVALPFDLLRREGVTLTRTLGFFVLSFFPLSKYSINREVCEAEASWSAAGLPLLLRRRGFVEMVTTLPSSGTENDVASVLLDKSVAMPLTELEPDLSLPAMFE